MKPWFGNMERTRKYRIRWLRRSLKPRSHAEKFAAQQEYRDCGHGNAERLQEDGHFRTRSECVQRYVQEQQWFGVGFKVGTAGSERPEQIPFKRIVKRALEDRGVARLSLGPDQPLSGR